MSRVHEERHFDATRRADARTAIARGRGLLALAGETDPSDILRAVGILATTRRDGSIVIEAPDKSVLVLSKGTTVVQLQGSLEHAARAELDPLTKPVFSGARQERHERIEAAAPLRPAAERKRVVVGGNDAPAELSGDTGNSLDMG